MYDPISILFKLIELQGVRIELIGQQAELRVSYARWCGAESEGMHLRNIHNASFNPSIIREEKKRDEARIQEVGVALLNNQRQIDHWSTLLRQHEIAMPPDVDLDAEPRVPALSDGG